MKKILIIFTIVALMSSCKKEEITPMQPTAPIYLAFDYDSVGIENFELYINNINVENISQVSQQGYLIKTGDVIRCTGFCKADTIFNSYGQYDHFVNHIYVYSYKENIAGMNDVIKLIPKKGDYINEIKYILQ